MAPRNTTRAAVTPGYAPTPPRCEVCAEVVDVMDADVLPCAHVFHKSCAVVMRESCGLDMHTCPACADSLVTTNSQVDPLPLPTPTTPDSLRALADEAAELQTVPAWQETGTIMEDSLRELQSVPAWQEEETQADAVLLAAHLCVVGASQVTISSESLVDSSSAEDPAAAAPPPPAVAEGTAAPPPPAIAEGTPVQGSMDVRITEHPAEGAEAVQSVPAAAAAIAEAPPAAVAEEEGVRTTEHPAGSPIFPAQSPTAAARPDSPEAGVRTTKHPAGSPIFAAPSPAGVPQGVRPVQKGGASASTGGSSIVAMGTDLAMATSQCSFCRRVLRQADMYKKAQKFKCHDCNVIDSAPS